MDDDYFVPAGPAVTMFADYNYNGVIDGDEPSTSQLTCGGYYDVLVAKRNFALTIIPPTGSRVTLPGGGVFYYEVHNGELVHYGSNFFGWY